MGLDICRAGHRNPQNPQITLHIEHGQQIVQYGRIMGRSGNNNTGDLSSENDLDRRHKKESLESQQELQALRRKINQNQREPGSDKSHREILPHGRAQSNSGAPRYGRRSPIFPTAIQKLQALQAMGRFIQSSQIIPCISQEKTRSPRENNFFQPEEGRSRNLDEETDGFHPRDAQKQMIFLPKNSIDSSESIDPELITENTSQMHDFENNDLVNEKFTWVKLSQFMECKHET
ncbi:hypothetical protein O181_020818 [Austropuccinia psidii MF-1]|uniref:Uncharacterized protein n=1 Tax=Austropuccinia psidii MF-1 TaxID=1389203 RepID=A0A9Q3GUV4_9BASI|nr:hypothetical protein [Austropuccinia psidii MF-1]